MKRLVLIFLLAGIFVSPIHAQEVVEDHIDFWLARVVSVDSEESRVIPGTETPTIYQTISARLIEGPQEGSVIRLDNDYLSLRRGETFYVRRAVDGISGRETYAVSEPYRLPALGWLAALFVVVLAAFGGKQGLRGLLSLGASLAAIVYLLLPGILAGYPPVLVAMGVASFIVVVGSYLTHGVNRATTAAVIGMLATIVITGAIAYASVNGARLSGFSSDEATYVNFNTQGSIDFVGLLLGGLLIGLLGVLYDAAISQAVAVEELVRAAAHYSRRELFARGLRIGREHIGALVNTLAIAYAGASLPLLLLVSQVSSNLSLTINQDLFATELVRIMVGSIGIILAVPVTTLVAVYMLHGRLPSDGRSLQHRH